MRWTTIKNGRKKNEIVVIVQDETIEDPWFGVDYADWHHARFMKDNNDKG